MTLANTDIILRNFFKLLKSGALGEFEEIEPMSDFKWNRLYDIALQQSVLHTAAAGIKCNPHTPAAMPQHIVDRFLEAADTMNHDDGEAKTDNALLTNKLLNHRIRRTRERENASEERSESTLHLFNLIITNTNQVLTRGISYGHLLPIGTFLRHQGDRVDFVKLDRWLEKCHIKNLAQLYGSILITTLDFEKEEVPFVSRIDPYGYRQAMRSLLHHTNVDTKDWQFHQSATGLVENDPKAMMRTVKNSMKYFAYAPIETTSNLLHSFIVNLAELEE